MKKKSRYSYERFISDITLYNLKIYNAFRKNYLMKYCYNWKKNLKNIKN